MQPDSPFSHWLVGLGVAAAIAIMALAVRQARRRTRELAGLAQRMGFTFVGNAWRGPLLSQNFKTSLMQRTLGRLSNVMTGQINGFEVSVFDYTHGSGKSRTTQTLTCFTQDAELPPFELRPENIFDKVCDAVLNRDIDFDSNPDFSRRYHLRTPDETRIRML